MADPAELPTLETWNATKLAAAAAAQGYAASGVQCPVGVHELFDIKGTESKADAAGISLPTIKVFCPVDGFKGERYL